MKRGAAVIASTIFAPACALIASVESVEYRTLPAGIDGSTLDASPGGGETSVIDGPRGDAAGSVFCAARVSNPEYRFCADFDSDATGEQQFSPIEIAVGGRGERVAGFSAPSAFALSAGPGGRSTILKGGIALPKPGDTPVTVEVVVKASADPHDFLTIAYSGNPEGCRVVFRPGRVSVLEGTTPRTEKVFSVTANTFHRYAVTLGPKPGLSVGVLVLVDGRTELDDESSCADTKTLEVLLGPVAETAPAEDVFDDLFVRH